jgi:adenosylmethionine-8-amino-7-oxononanoate aminotransferase
LAELERVVALQHDEIAAMVVEPLVQAAAGMLMQPTGYLAKVRELTKKYDVLLIVDEVATGFGRTGKMFACEHEHITPDLMTLSKGITGGYLPLAATLTTEAIYNAFLGDYSEHRTFYHGHSYTGNPLACAAALGNLQVFREENVIANLPPKMAVISNYLQKIAALSSVGDARQCGMIVGIELMQDKTRKLPFAPEQCMGAKVCAQARQMGLIIRPIGDVVIFMPPLASTCEEITAMLAIIYEAILAVQKDDKISASPIAL